jgi:hypothetical protein
VVAASFLAAACWLSIVALIFLAFLAFGDWLNTQEKKRRREVLREHRRRMDAIQPKRWVS